MVGRARGPVFQGVEPRTRRDIPFRVGGSGVDASMYSQSRRSNIVDMAYRVEELAASGGVSVDTVRYYQGLGLLPSPRRQGRVALYEERHLRRLSHIRELAGSGFTLRQIGDLVDRGDGRSDPLLEFLSEQSPSGPSNHRFGPSNRHFGPSNRHFGPSNRHFGPSNRHFGPSNRCFGRSNCLSIKNLRRIARPMRYFELVSICGNVPYNTGR